MGDFVEEQKTINAQLSQKINTMENNVNKKIDELQSEMEHKFDNLQYSISRLTNQQHVHQKEVNPEEECLIDTTVEEQCKQQKEETSPMLTEEEAVEEHQEHNLPLPLTDSIYILPSPASQSQPKIPATEAKAIPPLLPIQYFRKLMASIQTFATTSKTLAAAHTAWHSGWFGCRFKHGAPRPTIPLAPPVPTASKG